MTRKFRVRLMGAVTSVVAFVGVSLLGAAQPASALDQYCNYDGVTFNACLRFDYQGYLWWTVHVGFDRYLPANYAREIVNCPPSVTNLRASLWGEDGSNDQFIRNLPLTAGWPRTIGGPGSADGFGVEFDLPNVHTNELDEDDGEDEVYAKIQFTDCHTNLQYTYYTSTTHVYFGF